jgi:hypothetical protein
MAITNAQQFKQLVNPPMKGKKRPGYRGDDAAKSDRASGRSAGRADERGSVDRSRTSDRQNYNTAIVTGQNPLGIDLSKGPPDLTPKEKEFQKNKLNFSDRFKVFNLKKQFEIEKLKNKQKFGPLVGLVAQNLTAPELSFYESTDEDDIMDTDYGMSGEDLTRADRLADAINKAEETGDITQGEFEAAFYGPDGPPTSPQDGDGIQDPCKGPNPPAYCFVGIRSAEAATPVEEDDEIINYRLMSKGGRASFRGGDAARSDAASGRDAGRADPSGDVDDRGSNIQNATQYLATQGFSPKEINTITNPNIIDKFKNSRFNNPFTRTLGRVGLFAFNPALGPIDFRKTMQVKDIYDTAKKAGEFDIGDISNIDDDDDKNLTETMSEGVRNMPDIMDKTTKTKTRAEEILEEINKADGGRVGLMGGGMPYEGGIMDLESARQMYGLGKLVKKVTRGIKKIAKSPIGKIGLFGLASLPFGGPGAAIGAFKKLSPIQKALFGIGATSALAGLMTPKEEEEEPLYAGADIADPRYIMNNPGLFTNRRLAAEGGDIEKEPVAKKVMPLLDMDGKEKDYRETGGFVDMGRMEKADDVPARLSKNEFVFTADAVRNAGDGSVDKGAEVMYNMMKNLESGGEVSEESQGLEGAKQMFQTSKRLEEVL